jgi:hypothetical protein
MIKFAVQPQEAEEGDILLTETAREAREGRSEEARGIYISFCAGQMRSRLDCTRER